MKEKASAKDCAPQEISVIRGMASMAGTAQVRSNRSLVIVCQHFRKSESEC